MLPLLHFKWGAENTINFKVLILKKVKDEEFSFF